jgi:hypothetical protein
MTSHAVSGLPFGFLTISPDVYCAAVEGAVVILVICGVVFAEPELLVHAVINTHAMMSNSSPGISETVLFMVLTEPGEYFIKSFLAPSKIVDKNKLEMRACSVFLNKLSFDSKSTVEYCIKLRND